MPQPVPLVQCHGTGSEKRWNSSLLHRFAQTQHAHQEGFIPAAMDTRSTGEHVKCCPFFNKGF